MSEDSSSSNWSEARSSQSAATKSPIFKYNNSPTVIYFLSTSWILLSLITVILLLINFSILLIKLLALYSWLNPTMALIRIITKIIKASAWLPVNKVIRAERLRVKTIRLLNWFKKIV